MPAQLMQKNTRPLESLVGPAQFLVLAFQCLHTLRLCGSNTAPNAGIDLHALDPFIERLQHTANFGSDRFNGCLQRGVSTSVVLHHLYCAFAHTGENLFDFFVVQSFQSFARPQNTGRFKKIWPPKQTVV